MNIAPEIQGIIVTESFLEKAVRELQNDADKFAFEKKNNLSILLKANALKRTELIKEAIWVN